MISVSPSVELWGRILSRCHPAKPPEPPAGLPPATGCSGAVATRVENGLGCERERVLRRTHYTENEIPFPSSLSRLQTTTAQLRDSEHAAMNLTGGESRREEAETSGGEGRALSPQTAPAPTAFSRGNTSRAPAEILAVLQVFSSEAVVMRLAKGLLPTDVTGSPGPPAAAARLAAVQAPRGAQGLLPPPFLPGRSSLRAGRG